jgi:putative addiction module killer protein
MQIRRTKIFAEWLTNLRDDRARAAVVTRIRRLENGNPGVHRGVGGGVIELKIDFGPGYRVYYVKRGDLLILILCGGDKSTQSRDIERAKSLAVELNEEE